MILCLADQVKHRVLSPFLYPALKYQFTKQKKKLYSLSVIWWRSLSYVNQNQPTFIPPSWVETIMSWFFTFSRMCLVIHILKLFVYKLGIPRKKLKDDWEPAPALRSLTHLFSRRVMSMTTQFLNKRRKSDTGRHHSPANLRGRSGRSPALPYPACQ